MRDISYILSGLILVLASCLPSLAEGDPVAHVDPFIGTAGTGHTTPAACVPYGLVQAGPDTGSIGWKYCSGYDYADSRIVGFSQTHLNGTGWMDLGDVRLMPVPQDVDGPTAVAFSSRFDKASESASCGYYAVRLDDVRAKVEISASERVAIYRMTFDASSKVSLIADLQHGFVCNRQAAADYVRQADVKVVPDNEISGSRMTSGWVTRTCGFVVRFNRPYSDCVELPRAEGERAPRYMLTFDMGSDPELLVKVALSTKGPAAARRNMEAEMPGWDFEAVRAAAVQKWRAVLARAVIEGSEAQKKTWYTSLYHLCFQPNLISDAGEAPHYSTLSCWDTFRSAHPLYTLVDPERAGQFVQTMLRQGRETGYLPIWTLWGKENQGMIGTHSVPVIVDWFLKTRDPSIDWKAAYGQIKDTLTRPHKGRFKEDWAVYDRYGYYPMDATYGAYRGRAVVGETVSRTLECSYDDACAARMAKALGYGADAEFFARRANYWTNVFDVTTGFVRGRRTDGTWREPFDPYAFGHGSETANDFTEGNAFQYTWHVLQDPQGLIRALGGRERTAERLDALFSAADRGGFRSPDISGLIGQYVHGNEPSHHVIYFYTLAGRPDLAADRIREVCDRFYLPKPDGLCGNDDCGQMSAWYLFSAMGFYPFDPCGGEYVIGAPQVPRATLSLPDGRLFTVVAKDLSAVNRRVNSVRLNGRPVGGWLIRHADILKGGELVFEMGPARPRAICK